MPLKHTLWALRDQKLFRPFRLLRCCEPINFACIVFHFSRLFPGKWQWRNFAWFACANLASERGRVRQRERGEREREGNDNASVALCRQHENSIFMREFWWMLPNENMKRFARLFLSLSTPLAVPLTHALSLLLTLRRALTRARVCVCVWHKFLTVELFSTVCRGTSFRSLSLSHCLSLSRARRSRAGRRLNVGCT